MIRRAALRKRDGAGVRDRLALMDECIAHAMEVFPPRIHGVPRPFEIQDAVIFLQAFVVNVQGCTDDLAHM